MGNAGAYGAVAGERPMEQIVYTSRFYIFTPELAKMMSWGLSLLGNI